MILLGVYKGPFVWFIKNFKLHKNRNLLTRSRADPPPKYSMIIHSLVPCEKKKKDGIFIGFAFVYWTVRVCLSMHPCVCVASVLVLSSHLKVWAIILGNKRTITLAQHCDLLLNVFNLILCLLEVYNFYRYHLLGAVVDAFVDLSKRTLPNPLLLGEVLFWIQPGILVKARST